MYYSFWTIPEKTWSQIVASYVYELIKIIDDENIKKGLAELYFQNYPTP